MSEPGPEPKRDLPPEPSEASRPEEKSGGQIVLMIFLWTFWCVEVIGFVILFGCTALVGLDRADGLLWLVLLAGLALFVYAVKISLSKGSKGRQRPLIGASLLMLALFIVFGGCATYLN